MPSIIKIVWKIIKNQKMIIYSILSLLLYLYFLQILLFELLSNYIYFKKLMNMKFWIRNLEMLPMYLKLYLTYLIPRNY